jgi:hypothetical protein
MEGESTEIPLKVCRHCSVASRTDSETCPACGRPFRRTWWRWWFAIPIVALAFAGGYFGRKALQDEETQSGLTSAEAESLATGASPSELEQLLDGQEPADVRRQEAGGNELFCRYYTIVDREDEFWEFCFLNGRLEVARPVQVEPTG